MALLKTRPKPILIGKTLTLKIDDDLRGRLNAAQEAAYRQNCELDLQEVLLEYLRRTVPTLERQLGLADKPSAAVVTASAPVA